MKSLKFGSKQKPKSSTTTTNNPQNKNKLQLRDGEQNPFKI